MNLELRKSTLKNRLPKITITGSKSESNRLLLLQALYPEIDITNLSNSDDSQLMQKALCSNDEVIDIHHAGTAMRFLTAYFSVQPGREIVITGSKRMKERPIRILVHALTELGADIEYMENTGFPPLKIKGKDFKGGQVTMNANVSSQYISALLLIAPKLKKGIELTLKGNITSSPYILMTLRLLEEIGVNTSFKNNIIKVDSFDKKIDKRSLFVESDWSSASYFYSIIALSKVGTELELSYFKEHSLQGDSSLAKIYEGFGVQTEFRKDSIILTKINSIDSDLIIELDLANSPDIAQTIVVTCFGLGLECKLTGLHTLKIKETDRLVSLKTELENLGGQVKITGDSLHLYKSSNIVKDVAISTYNDHRMAMAFAPLALKTSLFIKDSNVVSKSYPDFWKDLESIGIDVININSL